MTLRLVLIPLALLGTAGALALGTLETDAASAYWQARPGLETAGPVALVASLVSLLIGTVGLVVDRVLSRRTPAVDSHRALTVRLAWTGWVLVGAAAAFAVVLVAALVGLGMIEAAGGCGDASSWCGFGTAIVAFGAGVVSTALAAVGGALLGWSGRAAAGAGAAGRTAVPTAAGPGW